MTQAPIAITMGEPAGIGPDLVLQLYASAKAELPAFAIYGSLGFLQARARTLGLTIELQSAAPESAAHIFPSALPVIAGPVQVPNTPGQFNEGSARAVTAAIEMAVKDTMFGLCRAVVTAPIHKSALYQSGFSYPGHTEFLAALCAEKGQSLLPVMMLAHDHFRVVPLTIHVPIKDVPGLVSAELIGRTAIIVLRDLQSRFGIAKPKLAIAGLNPHAGEDGTIGTEERDIILPAIQSLQDKGYDVTGPISADTLFHPPHWQQYDCVIAMYHDQALIPIKTLAFDKGVNVTLGLPIIRTSPDHGTALSLAGTGKASTSSMRAAIEMADLMSRASL